MPAQSFALSYKDSFPMLDDEFDRLEAVPPSLEQVPALYLCDDLAWDDQINSGHELSL